MKNIFGIAFLVWFFTSLAGMFLVAKTENPAEWLMILFGQYFLVFGVIAIYANKGTKHFPTIILMFPLVGLACIGSGIYIMVGGEDSYDNMNVFAPFLIVAAFFVAGLLMLHMSLSEMLYLKRVCTYEVSAKCVDITTSLSKRKHGGYNEIYMPIYSFWFNDTEQRIWNNQYSSKKFTIGDYYTLMVNPNDVNDFIDGNARIGNIGLLTIGIVFITVSSIIMILMLKWTFGLF